MTKLYEGKGLSPAMKLVDLIWTESDYYARNGDCHSFSRLNQSLHKAVSLAITSKLPFSIKDFKILNSEYDFYRWAGIQGHMLGEGLYSLACNTTNLSACQSFEHYKEREPFIFPDVWGSNKRIYVGNSFKWEDSPARCTSFSEKGDSFVAVPDYHDAPKRIFRISREKLIEARKNLNSD